MRFSNASAICNKSVCKYQNALLETELFIYDQANPTKNGDMFSFLIERPWTSQAVPSQKFILISTNPSTITNSLLSRHCIVLSWIVQGKASWRARGVTFIGWSTKPSTIIVFFQGTFIVFSWIVQGKARVKTLDNHWLIYKTKYHH